MSKNHHHKITSSSSSSSSSSSHSHRGGGGSNGGTATGQACAACKYQRRKCASDCILAPYFPHDRQRQFLNAHKLFGVSNITKIIKKLEQPDQKDEAMRTIILQSDVRAHDPVGGCYRVIRELQRQIDFSQAELNIVLHQLALCRAQAQQTLQQMNPNIQISLPADSNNVDNIDNNDHDDHSSTFVDPNCDLVISNPNGPTALGSCHHHDPSVLDYSSNIDHDHHNQQEARQQEDQQYDIFGRGISGPNDVVPFQDIDSWGMRNISGPASLEVKQPSSSLHDECDDMKRLLLNELDLPTDDQHNFRFEFEETIEPPCSRDEIIYNEEKALIKEEEDGSFQQIHQDHDLKGAATLFTLTNCTSY